MHSLKGGPMNQLVYNWYLTNVSLLQRIYGKVTYAGDLSWILIWNYDLPPVFNQTHSSLLVATPREDISNHEGYAYFLNQHLYRIDRKPTNHLYEDSGYNYLAPKGYSRLSYHPSTFRPTSDVASGDNLVSICKAIYYFLGDERGA